LSIEEFQKQAFWMTGSSLSTYSKKDPIRGFREFSVTLKNPILCYGENLTEIPSPFPSRKPLSRP
jgi:hypothetical protein